MKLNINNHNALLYSSTNLTKFSTCQPVFDDDVNDVPIDGGLSLLIAAGVGYGAKKMRDNKLKNKL
jgi:hypothetical protein